MRVSLVLTRHQKSHQTTSKLVLFSNHNYLNDLQNVSLYYKEFLPPINLLNQHYRNCILLKVTTQPKVTISWRVSDQILFFRICVFNQIIGRDHFSKKCRFSYEGTSEQYSTWYRTIEMYEVKNTLKNYQR